jgi:hypothetical protein
MEVSDIHIVNCIATLMSARFPQDVTDMILPLDQSMQHIQFKKHTPALSDLSYWNFFVHLSISKTKMNLIKKKKNLNNYEMQFLTLREKQI